LTETGGLQVTFGPTDLPAEIVGLGFQLRLRDLPLDVLKSLSLYDVSIVPKGLGSQVGSAFGLQ